MASDINATIRQGELTCLLGPNGVGKSTLLRTLAAFQPALGGTISHGNIADISQLSPAQLSRLISVVLTEKPDVRNMTVKEMVALGRSPYTGFWGRLTDDDEVIVSESIRQVGITSLQRRRIETLSDGERQKVMITKALAQHTPIIYLDEPTAFLDYPSKVEVMKLLHRLAHTTERVIFMSTHDLELALQLADNLWLMQANNLTVGTPQELAEAGYLSKFLEGDGISFDRQSLTIKIK